VDGLPVGVPTRQTRRHRRGPTTRETAASSTFAGWPKGHDELIRYKQAHHPDDRRRILTCGIPDGKVRVEWLNPAAPGVDSKWEMQLYGLVRTGQRDKALRFLQDTRRMTRSEASKRVTQIAAELGMK
jgi:hypothetical protein